MKGVFAMKKVFLLASLLVLTLVSTTACYYNKQVGSNQIGLKMDDGVTISEVVGSGRYTNLGWYAGLTCIDTASHTLVWEDADVWTSDKQVVGFTASATYARKSDEESVRKMWKEYNAAARDDEQLDQLVRSRIPRIVKQVSTQMTLDEMLGIAESDKNRTTLQENIEFLLSAELDNCGIQLIDFGVNNISVDPVYQSKMQEKSTAAIEIELAQQRAQQLEKQLEQEKAQTEIDLEKARRNNLVAEENAKVYEESKEAYELKRLELLKDMLGESDKVYFIPEGTDITLFLGNEIPTKALPNQ